MNGQKEELVIAGSIGASNVNSARLFPDNLIAKLVAVIYEKSPGKFETKEGKIPTREMFAMATQGKADYFANSGYILRVFKDTKWLDGSPEPRSIIELWLVEKKLVFEVRRALIDPKSGKVLLMPAFEIDLKQAEGKNDFAKVRSIGIYYKLPGTSQGSETTSMQTLDQALTPEVLIDQSANAESFSELGIGVSTPIDFMFYLMINHYPDKIVERWTIMIPTPSDCWSYPAKKSSGVKYLGPNELIAFLSTGLIDEKTFELSLAALSLASQDEDIRNIATQILKEKKPGYESNVYSKGEEDIFKLRSNIKVQ